MHREESRVIEDERQEEVGRSEALAHEPSEEQRKPVVDAREDAEESGSRHDDVEVADDEGCVVQLDIDLGLPEPDAGQPAGDEQGEGPKRPKHRSRELESPVP